MLAERFWSKVDIRGPDECWVYTAGLYPNGYGHFWIDGGNRGAHRVAFFLTHGYWPKVCRHTCDNPPCCNPRHLKDGTVLDNVRDKIDKGRLFVADGERHYMAKFNDDLVNLVRSLVESGATQVSVAHRFGISPSWVSRIVRHEGRKGKMRVRAY